MPINEPNYIKHLNSFKTFPPYFCCFCFNSFITFKFNMDEIGIIDPLFYFYISLDSEKKSFDISN
jgi:hypothetical protein